MAGKRKNLPEFYRRALRLAINVGLAAITGYSLLDSFGGWESVWGKQLMQGTKWAAITSVVCNHPVISKTTEAALERVLGTVTGGLLGYGLSVAIDTVPLLDHQFVTILGLMAVAFVSIILGYKLKLDYAGRLFIMTFILVATAAPKKSDAFVVAVTRISGIVYGVILTMVMSVIVFPKSASHQATDNLQVGLTKLAELNRVAWTKGEGCTALFDIMHPPLFTTMSAERQRAGDQDPVDIVVGSRVNNGVLDEGADECCDEALSEVYARLATCQEFTAMSKSETYIFTTRGRWVFFPAFKCFPWRTALPNSEMGRVTTAARKVARLLWCLHTSLPEEDDVAVLERYCGAAGFLTSLGKSLQVYLENLAASFPNQQNLESSELYNFIQGVETLITASHKATDDSTILLKSAGGTLATRTHTRTASLHDTVSNASPPSFSPASSLADCNVAFICENGAVTRVGGLTLSSSFAKDMASRDGEKNFEHFSPVSELLPEGSSTEEVLQAAAEAAIAEGSRKTLSNKHATKEGYISQVRWQATQFLLRRLTRELTILNSAFIRLSVMLPPTRWESRRRKAEKKSLSLLQEPLLGV